jgi:hypothetical protein
MNERPATTGFREGFVDPNKPAAKAAPMSPTQPQQQTNPVPPPESSAASQLPPPELEPSLVESDAPEISQEPVWPMVVKLVNKPLQIPGGPLLTELSFREPRGGDINRYGNPVRTNREGDFVIEERKMHWIMAALSGVQPPFLDMLHPRDWNSCAQKLAIFFVPDPRAF